MLAYMAENVEAYKGFARMITPDTRNPEQVYSRVAFAILSANVQFSQAVKALDVACELKGKVKAEDITPFGMVPGKAEYCNEAWELINQTWIGIGNGKDWQRYRFIFQKLFRGLGLAKASFAVALLYPLEADVACIDTWMQKVFLGKTSFKQLGLKDYMAVEARVRRYARRFGVSTFLAQWMIWDFSRNKGANEHNIFPGAHK
jgi:thermostable 8-oxoguanine DNA glycosylase